MTGSGSALAIDHGTKRTGFAVADPLRIAVEPLDAWHGPGEDEGLLDHIARLLAEREVGTFVVGYPLNMDGSAGPRAAAVDRLIVRLRQRFADVDVVRQDERLSTKEAEELLRSAGYRGRAARSRRDSWSALVILRDWITAGEPDR
jgi:putative Holliday junction resolvase